MQETLGPDELVGSVVAGRYLIDERLGNGAMGAVYRARHVKLGRPFAIKILHDHLSDEKVLKRFEREAEIAGKLHHPNLVSVVDVGAIGGRSFLVMELAPGSNLAGLLTGPWPASRVIPLVRQLCDGLHYAHELGLIHRDFKPENVIVERHADNRETPRIVDFGIAILRDATAERFTTAGLVLGTPQYMAPEQACAADMDHRVDLFALGVICFELLTGRAPFDGTGVEIARANLLTPTPAMAARAPTVQVDPLLEAFTRKLLAKAKEDRPVSAAATRQLLDLIERDRPAAAKALKVALPKTTALAPPVATSGPIPRPVAVAVAASSRASIGTDRTVEATPAQRRAPREKSQRWTMLVAGIAMVAFASAIAVAVWAARRSSDEPATTSSTSSGAPPMGQSASPTSSGAPPMGQSASPTSPPATSTKVATSSTNAATSSTNAATSSTNAATSSTNAGTSSTNAATTAATSTTSARPSTTTGTSSSGNASATSAKSSTTAATSSSGNASTTSAKSSTTAGASSGNAASTASSTHRSAATTATTGKSTTTSTSSATASPSASAVASLYVAVGGELKAFSEANGQSAAADLWSRYRRIPLNDVLVTPARRQATTELLLQIRRDLSARRSQ